MLASGRCLVQPGGLIHTRRAFGFCRFGRYHARRMPKRTDIKTILIIGSGPIVIGQGCEFDYSGTRLVKP